MQGDKSPVPVIAGELGGFISDVFLVVIFKSLDFYLIIFIIYYYKYYSSLIFLCYFLDIVLISVWVF